MSLNTLVSSSDNLIKLDALTDSTTGAYVNSGATVVANVYTEDGLTLVAGPITLSYVASSNGNYSGTLDKSVGLTVGDFHKIVIDVTAGGGLERRFVMRVVVAE